MMHINRGATFERITWQDTLRAAWWFIVVIIGVRLGWCLVLWMIIICIGPQAGGLIAVSLAVRQHFSILQRRAQINKYLPIAVGVSVFLVFLGFFDYWPKLLAWSWIDHQMYWKISCSIDFLFVHWNGTDWIAAESSAVILRFLSGLALPIIVWMPAQWFDWILRIESLWPGVRELRCKPASPEGIPGAEGWALKEPRSAPRPVAQDNSPDVAYVPQPVYRG